VLFAFVTVIFTLHCRLLVYRIATTSSQCRSWYHTLCRHETRIVRPRNCFCVINHVEKKFAGNIASRHLVMGY